MELKHAIVLAQRQHQYHRQWARAPDKSEWHETWAEEFSTSGAVQRSADKFGCKAPGSIPEDGHANRWQERWGENWDGHGNVLKWTDKWAERDQSEGGGPPRSWGDKWEERNAETGGSKNVRAHTIENTVLPVVSPRLPALRLTDCPLCDCVTTSLCMNLSPRRGRPGPRTAVKGGPAPGAKKITAVVCIASATALAGNTGTSGRTGTPGSSRDQTSDGTTPSDTRLSCSR